MGVAPSLKHPSPNIIWAFKTGVTNTPVQLVSAKTPCRGVMFGRDLLATLLYRIGDATNQPIIIAQTPAEQGAFIPTDDASKLYVVCTTAGPIDIPYGIVT